MYTKQALRELGVAPAGVTEAQKRQFEEQGFFTVERILTASDLEAMRAESLAGSAAQSPAVRKSAAAARSRLPTRVVRHSP